MGDALSELENYTPPADVDNYVERLSPDGPTQLDPENHVRSMDETTESDGNTTITLNADILFDPYQWSVPDSAAEKVRELLDDAPANAEVTITGHTDSLPTGPEVDFDNQELSERRAEAVAELINENRDDLDIEAIGLGDTDPAVNEVDDDPDTYAANRRVEITFASADE